ncbi:MAG: hypothetical protein KF733_03380 [Fimbriimonadaceae bacterium]|nr:MAG: hypothetical protein KF733_03380 [Fimbriimonadaceae bacterium]
MLTFPIRSDKLSMNVKVSREVVRQRSKFQDIWIVDTEVFGRTLLLDGHIQLTEFDEKAYHELLVQIPLMALAAPRRALVVGGGDGGVIREICRRPEIQQVDIVEIDQAVVDLCREHMPSLSDGAFDDPRVRLHVADAFEFVKTAEPGYDLIVQDSTDVYEEESGELSERLFTEPFFRDLAGLLSPAGLIVTQADNLVFCPYSLEAIRADFERVFSQVGSYWGLVPSFGGFSGFCWASHGAAPSPSWEAAPWRPTAPVHLNPLVYEMAYSRLPYR